MAAAGGGRRGAGGDRQAIGAALSAGRAEPRAQVYARHHFNDLAALLRNFATYKKISPFVPARAPVVDGTFQTSRGFRSPPDRLVKRGRIRQ